MKRWWLLACCLGALGCSGKPAIVGARVDDKHNLDEQASLRARDSARIKKDLQEVTDDLERAHQEYLRVSNPTPALSR